jgi:hypothetical protein
MIVTVPFAVFTVPAAILVKIGKLPWLALVLATVSPLLSILFL